MDEPVTGREWEAELRARVGGQTPQTNKAGLTSFIGTATLHVTPPATRRSSHPPCSPESITVLMMDVTSGWLTNGSPATMAVLSLPSTVPKSARAEASLPVATRPAAMRALLRALPPVPEAEAEAELEMASAPAAATMLPLTSELTMDREAEALPPTLAAAAATSMLSRMRLLTTCTSMARLSCAAAAPNSTSWRGQARRERQVAGGSGCQWCGAMC